MTKVSGPEQQVGGTTVHANTDSFQRLSEDVAELRRQVAALNAIATAGFDAGRAFERGEFRQGAWARNALTEETGHRASRKPQRARRPGYLHPVRDDAS